MELRDPIHQFITLTDLERRIIDTEAVQRLRHVRQLSLTSFVYPGAVHTRFEHALGTMELAGRAFDAAMRNSDVEVLDSVGIRPETTGDARRLVRLGALLHDVGHPPFSHGPEELFPTIDGRQLTHEDMTVSLVKAPPVADALRANALELADPDAVAAVAAGPHLVGNQAPAVKLLSDLIAGTLGVDRMDYLLRDSLYTGARYGQFDLSRLITTLKVSRTADGDAVWALTDGGSYIAEQFLMARFFMTLQVYNHKTRRILDYHLRKFLEGWLPDGKLPTVAEHHLQLTDIEVLGALRVSDNVHARAIRAREHLREVQVFSRAEFHDPADFTAFVEIVRTDYPEVVGDSFSVHLRKAGDAELWIESPRGLVSLETQSDIVRSLEPRWIGRIYAPVENRKDVNQLIQRKMEVKGAE